MSPETTSLLGAARYGVTTAPTGLRNTQELLNTAASTKAGQPDILEQPRLAGEWLRELRAVTAPDAADAVTPDPTPGELLKLIELRGSIAAALVGSAPSRVRTDVRLEMAASGRVQVGFGDLPVPRLIAAVLVEALLAQQGDEWRRLKICANPLCDISFYDRSKNRSGVWHDVHVCGNAINLRASRSRRRAEHADSGARVDEREG
jgi:hypothetical protein